MSKKIKGIKGFKKDLTCKGFQFKEGETFETKKAVICSEGFHYCENPFDVLNYYDLLDSEFAEVEPLGEVVGHDEDSKKATTKIKIGVKLGLSGFVKACVSFLLEITKPEKIKDSDLSDNGKKAAKIGSSGYYAQIGSSGDSAQIGSSGYYAQIG